MISNTIRKLINRNSERMNISPEVLEDGICFLINTNYIAVIDHGINDNECREMLINYLKAKENWIEIKDILFRVYPNQKQSNPSNEDAYKIIIEDPAFKYHLNRYYFNVTEGIGLDLSDSITLDKNRFIDRDYFYYFLAYRLSKVELDRVIDFFSFVSFYHYDNNTEAFILDISSRLFLNPKYRRIIGAEKLNILTKTTGEQTEENDHSFRHAFRTIELYNNLINQLSQRVHGASFDKDGNFTRRLRDNAKYCVTLVDILIRKNYFRTDIIWTIEYKSEFIEKNFGIKVSTKSSTWKRTHKTLEQQLSMIVHNLH